MLEKAQHQQSNTASGPRNIPLVELLISVAGSLLGTWVSGALGDGSEVRLIGAVIGAAIPALLPALLPSKRTTPLVATVVTLVAILLTYLSLTTVSIATETPPVFPVPPVLPTAPPSPSKPPTSAVYIPPVPVAVYVPPVPGPPLDGGLPQIDVSPKALTCTAKSCSSPVTVRNVGNATLAIGGITFDGSAAGSYGSKSSCAHKSFGPGKSCVVTVRFTPSGQGGQENAVLVINHNGPNKTISIPIVGDGGPVPVVNLNVTPGNIDCRFLRLDGSEQAQDALQLQLSVRLTQGSPFELDRPVSITATSNLGPTVRTIAALSKAQLTLAYIPLRASDFNKSHIIAVIVDPANEIPETNEHDNTISVTVVLPSQPPSATRSVPLSCFGT